MAFRPLMLIDSHCHLDNLCFDPDRDAVLDRAREAGVELFLTVGTGDGPPDLEPALRLAERYHDVYATVGVHPHDAAKAKTETYERLAALCRRPKVLALGEIGLDYHYDFSPRDVQQEVFLRQLEVASAARKPIIIHTREAWADTLDLLWKHWRSTGLGGVLHCFTGDLEQARQGLEIGMHISFAGVLTFARSDKLREAARALPLERLLVETDSPYLTPEPHRKIKRNEPRFVIETARRLAEIRGLPLGEIAAATSRNFRNLFGLP